MAQKSSTLYWLAIDQGTTATKVLLINQHFHVVREVSMEFPLYYPEVGWVEQDAEQIWESVLKGIKVVTQQIDPAKIEAIGITNQRETVCFWDAKEKKVLARSIVWQDRRTASLCEDLKKSNLEPFFQEKTGLVLDPYFSATKIAWALKHWEPVKKAAQRGTLQVGTVDSFLLWKLTSAMVHATEPSNASRTLLFHLGKLNWDRELISVFGFSDKILPQVVPSFSKMGFTKNVPGLRDGIPIAGMLGDQQAALLGQGAVEPGMAKCTYGTGAFILVHAGDRFKKSQSRLLSTVAWLDHKERISYALEGSAFIAGAALDWARSSLGFVKKTSELNALAKTVDSSEGVVFVPALTGLGAPYWEPQARGLLTGLTRGTTKAHIARALLEGIAFEITDIFQVMEKDIKKPFRTIRVDGGVSQSDFLMQFQADLLKIVLERPKIKHATAFGASFAAALGVGFLKEVGQVQGVLKIEKTFQPRFSSQQREEAFLRWTKALRQVQSVL